MSVNIHPSVDHGVKAGSADFAGGVLTCHCTDKPVKVKIDNAILHNHVCGCTKCWKPSGANFSMVAVAPSDKVSVLENGDKLHVVDASATIQRMACSVCGVHMHGPVLKSTRSRASASFIPNCSTTPAPPPRFCRLRFFDHRIRRASR